MEKGKARPARGQREGTSKKEQVKRNKSQKNNYKTSEENKNKNNIILKPSIQHTYKAKRTNGNRIRPLDKALFNLRFLFC
ncbi:hypothetical protein ACT3CE_17775 [Marinifilum sp. RC60d5]|uniref:hypothetical protein n=1 Tax=Marinifilum sp. RC60d5 TaxID=3458414 RepID=UPI0040351F7C